MQLDGTDQQRFGDDDGLGGPSRPLPPLPSPEDRQCVSLRPRQRSTLTSGDTRFDDIRTNFWKFAGFWGGQILWVWTVGALRSSDQRGVAN